MIKMIIRKNDSKIVIDLRTILIFNFFLLMAQDCLRVENCS